MLENLWNQNGVSIDGRVFSFFLWIGNPIIGGLDFTLVWFSYFSMAK